MASLNAYQIRFWRFRENRTPHPFIDLDMKYIDAEKIRAEIERRHAYQKEMYSKTKPDGRPNDGWAESLAIMGELEELRNFLDTLEEEPDKSLEEAARNNADSTVVDTRIEYCGATEDVYFYTKLLDAFIAGAQWQEKRDEETIKTAEDHAFLAGADWQKEQFEKNRLAHCDAVSQEDCDRETDFAMEIIEKEHRQPTFLDAINYGMRLQKDALMEWLDGKMTIEGATEGFVGGYDSALKDVIEHINKM